MTAQPRLTAALLAATVFWMPTMTFAAAVSSPQVAAVPAQAANPLLAPWTTANGVPPYNLIRTEHYIPAFDQALVDARKDLDAIANQTSPATFANTVEALEKAGQKLSAISSAFFTVSAADAKPEIQKIEEDVSPKLTRFSNDTYLNPKLFARVDQLYKNRAQLNLTPEQDRLLYVVHKAFVRAGAALDEKSRARVAAINEELSKLGVTFGQNLLADQKSGDVFLTAAEVAGLSDAAKAAAAAGAKAAGREGMYLIRATRSAVEPFLFVAQNRAAREKVFRAFNMRGDNGNANDNTAVIRSMLTLRAERAKLMGESSHAEFVLDDTMAKTPEAAMELLRAVFDPALVRAAQEEKDLLAIAAKDGITKLEPWDWRYYSEQVRQQRYNLNEAALREYLPLDGMLAALMETTQRLFGLTFHERDDVPVYAPGVRVWEIREADGKVLGLFYGDFFARDTKQPGAWMNSLREQSQLLGQMPIVVNNCNFTPPAQGGRALLSLDDTRTLFHEFGHALHGLLSNVRYPSLSGTAVSRDFVEFPAQVYEHWMSEPSVLRKHAKNAAGQSIPEDMLQAVLKARTFNQGFLTVQQLSSAILDMDLHSKSSIPADFDMSAWEQERLAALKVPTSIGMRHRLAHFSHIFDGGYSAGYYSYTWSEAMDADGFDAFKETGDVFNQDMARKLRKEVYERGNSRDPADSYKAFRGRMPTADALLRNRGLAPAVGN